MLLTWSTLALTLALSSPPGDEVSREARRLLTRVEAGRGLGEAVDVIRLDALGDHLPRGAIQRHLEGISRDRRRPPLVRAVADYALLSRARRDLDAEAIDAAARRLGLLQAASIRPGPEGALPADGWRPVTPIPGGVLQLEALLRPHEGVTATIAARIESREARGAVLRLGADDKARVSLNGEQIYEDDRSHGAWLDQIAAPIRLREGANLLVVELEQEDGAWRLLARITDPEGAPLEGITAHADLSPFAREGRLEPPEPPEIEPPAEIEWIWGALRAASEGEDAAPEALLDYAEYARRARLPDREMLAPRVAIEGAMEVAPSARALRAWLHVLPEDERALTESLNPLMGPLPESDIWAALGLDLDRAWRHYYARRHGATRRALTRLLKPHPGYLPAYRLQAVLYEDLNLPHRAVATLEAARARWPGRVALWRAWISALRSAGRTEALRAALSAPEAPRGADEALALAHIEAQRGETEAALGHLERVHAARPDLWGVGLEAAELEIAVGRRGAAKRRLEALLEALPGEPRLLAPLARLYLDEGGEAKARALLAAAAAPDEGLDALRARLDGRGARAPLGPPLEALMARPALEGAVGAEVLYQHAHLELGRGALATRRLRKVARITDDAGGARFEEWQIAYVPGSQVLELEEARLLRAGQPAMSPSRSDIALSEPEFRLYYDLRAEVLTFPKPKRGDVIEVAWRLKDVMPDPAFPDYFGEITYLQGEAPTHEARVTFGAGVERLKVHPQLRGMEDLDPGPGVWIKGVAAAPYEPRGPGASSLRAYLHASTIPTWAALDQRYQPLLEGRLRPNDKLEALARAWIGDAVGDEARLARLYQEVAHRTRYVGLEFGVRSFQPAYPSETLARGYGDCKDKAALLIALARSVGVPAEFVLLRTRGLGALTDPQPSFALFDHAIVYAPSLGRFMDPTVDRGDPWALPPGDQGAVAFIAGRSQAPQIVPFSTPEQNEMTWAFDLEGIEAGVARGALTLVARGQPATSLRRRLEGEAHPKQPLTQLVARRFPGASIADLALEGITPARDPLTVRLQLSLPLERRGGRLTLADQRRLTPELARVARRETPLEIRYPWSERVVARLKGAALHAEPRRVEGPFGALKRATEGGVVTQTLRLSVPAVSPEDYPAFREWLDAVDHAALRLEIPEEAKP